MHYPDLRTEPPSELEIESGGGTRLLRFANKVYNAGDGRLELKPSNNGSTRRTEVVQRLYSHTNAGVWYVADERRAGAVTFHPSHNHWHFEKFALYELRNVAADGSIGTLVRSGEKTTFCVMDTYKKMSLEHTPLFARYTNCGTQDTVQGISVGWGDRYGPELDGQHLDISTVPDGTYWVKSTADYKNLLAEKNEANNGAATKVRISGSRVTVLATQTDGQTGGDAPASDAAITVSPTEVDFGAQKVGTTSEAKTVTASSTGASDLVVSSSSVSGANASEFRITSDSCTGASLAPGGTCELTVTFSPSLLAVHGSTRRATLTIESNAAPVSVAMEGTASLL